MHPQLIDTTSALVTFLYGLGQCQDQPPSLYIDLEGNNLSRHGTLSLMTMLVEPQQMLYLIDVTTLGNKAFDTSGSGNRSIKTILESKDIVKVFFEIRNDSDALFSLYGIRVDGVEDLQLLELASRSFSKRCVNGLAKCIEGDSSIGYTEKRDWQRAKNNGRRLFDPARGGSYAVFDQRPLAQEVLDYCAQDVTLMPHLRERYCKKLCDAWWVKIADETKRRIEQSQQSYYNGKGRHMALGPTTWSGWNPSSAEKGVRTLFEISRPQPEAPPVKTSSSTEGRTSPKKKPEALETLDPHATALRASILEANQPHTDSDDAYDTVGCSSYHGHGLGGSSGEESDGARDLTACDKECGYCGRCPY